jgi:hypothetical protein
MSHKPTDRLTRLLRRWAKRHAPDEAEQDLLRARLRTTVQETPFLDPESDPSALHSRHPWRPVAWASVGAAAALVAMLAFWPAQPPGRQDSPSSSDRAAALAAFPDRQLAEKTAVLTEMERLFGGRLAWFAEVDHEIRLGVTPEASRGAAMVVRVVVVARRGREDSWKPVWAADVVTHGEEVVELAPVQGRGGKLQLWTCPLPDGTVAVDAELALNQGLALRSSSTGVQQDGTPCRTFSLRTDGVEYQVYQTITMLKRTG